MHIYICLHFSQFYTFYQLRVYLSFIYSIMRRSLLFVQTHRFQRKCIFFYAFINEYNKILPPYGGNSVSPFFSKIVAEKQRLAEMYVIALEYYSYLNAYRIPGRGYVRRCDSINLIPRYSVQTMVRFIMCRIRAARIAPDGISRCNLCAYIRTYNTYLYVARHGCACDIFIHIYMCIYISICILMQLLFAQQQNVR